ncbi:MAG: ribonucleotide-triphosphate reductase, partial [Thermoprotei archaeon]
MLCALAVLAGYNVSVREWNPPPPSKKLQYIITLTETKLEYIQEIKETEYKGIIWSVNTENETVIAMRKGCIFITGNTPFTNFTVTLDAPRKMLSGDYAIYAGKKVEPLGEYYDEARLFVKALAEILYEGDSLGQPFTFPIPTIMVTAKTIWDDPEIHEAVFKTAAHRGSFYWLNTRLVDPDASYSMCCR